METHDDFDLIPPADSPPSCPPSTGRRLKRLKRVSQFVMEEPATVNVEDVDVFSSAADDSSEAPMEPAKEDEFHTVSDFDPVAESMDSGADRVDELIGEPQLNLDGDSSSDSMGRKKKKMNKTAMKKQRDSDNNGTDDGIDANTAPPVTNKRSEEKERRVQMQQLRVDSQRVLRESRDASFEPIPMVPKPISSVLEKIRKRKLEISNKFVSSKSNNSVIGCMDSSDEEDVDLELEDHAFERTDATLSESVMKGVAAESSERTSLDSGIASEPKYIAQSLNPETVTPPKTSDEEFNPAFEAPTVDSQKLFLDQEVDEVEEDPLTDSPISPLEEVFAPSVLVTKLKFDAVDPHMSDDDDDDEENDKENIDPCLQQDVDPSPLTKDPVKNFLDDEAEEEADSDDNPFNGQDDEDEDIEDAEDLHDMIATNYVEKPVDKDMRDELHQKWLEQQDARGMENLLQRMKGVPSKTGATMLEDEEGTDDDEEESGDSDEELGEDNGEGLAAKTLAQMNLKKAKQTISEMYTEKDDPYVSSDDEESERILTKQSLSEKMDGQTKLPSPADDKSSREVFSRIKKLNIMPEKKRTKPSALQDLSLASGRGNGFLKPSFLGRGSNSSMPLKNQKKSTVRAFIFGRDASNSKSSESVSEESSDPVHSHSHRESRPARTPAKFTSSQTKASSSQSNQVYVVNDATTSLLDILRRPSTSKKSDSCVQEIVDVRTQSIFAAFRIGKRSREGRVLT